MIFLHSFAKRCTCVYGLCSISKSTLHIVEKDKMTTFSLILSLNSPVYQDERLLCFAFPFDLY